MNLDIYFCTLSWRRWSSELMISPDRKTFGGVQLHRRVAQGCAGSRQGGGGAHGAGRRKCMEYTEVILEEREQTKVILRAFYVRLPWNARLAPRRLKRPRRLRTRAAVRDGGAPRLLRTPVRLRKAKVEVERFVAAARQRDGGRGLTRLLCRVTDGAPRPRARKALVPLDAVCFVRTVFRAVCGARSRCWYVCDVCWCHRRGWHLRGQLVRTPRRFACSGRAWSLSVCRCVDDVRGGSCSERHPRSRWRCGGRPDSFLSSGVCVRREFAPRRCQAPALSCCRVADRALWRIRRSCDGFERNVVDCPCR